MMVREQDQNNTALVHLLVLLVILIGIFATEAVVEDKYNYCDEEDASNCFSDLLPSQAHHCCLIYVYCGQLVYFYW